MGLNSPFAQYVMHTQTALRLSKNFGDRKKQSINNDSAKGEADAAADPIKQYITTAIIE